MLFVWWYLHRLLQWEHPQGVIPLYHVQISGGGIVYQDYFTTNPPVRHDDLPWYESLTNWGGGK